MVSTYFLKVTDLTLCRRCLSWHQENMADMYSPLIHANLPLLRWHTCIDNAYHHQITCKLTTHSAYIQVWVIDWFTAQTFQSVCMQSWHVKKAFVIYLAVVGEDDADRNPWLLKQGREAGSYHKRITWHITVTSNSTRIEILWGPLSRGNGR